MLASVLNVTYLVGAVALVLGLRGMSSPDTARRGNLWAAAGIGIAIATSLIYPFEGAEHNNYGWIAGALILGSIFGWLAAMRVKMTAMPQMVSIFNGLGGACAVLLAVIELQQAGAATGAAQLSVLMLTLLIGGVAFSGSILAYLKLDGKVWDSQVTLPYHGAVNLVLLLATVGFGVYLTTTGNIPTGLLIGLLVLTLVYGFSFVAPIGGADMPVVISLLNSFTGLSAATAGIVYGNQIMLVGGILVGASGTILTILMCRAMNRSLLNVIIGNFGGGGAASGGADGDQVVKTVNPSDLAIQLFYAKSVVIIPGYGLAVAQAQKTCKELDDLLSANGVDVVYAIHPVAGRMPGHMNVLLAEADVPYPKLLDLDAANDTLAGADVVLIIGANDVVNPDAENDPASPLYGMPVLKAWTAKQTVVLKRSMSPGYAGVQNPLFFLENNKMLFGDAKASLQELVGEVKNL
ncbi:NAD(P)(+) transhydrogenase (Re/Si-specific) subunit beta [Lewinella sp. W8]|uniref:NAD(P)(+) transhydrogenase (Re/Si-specific) subunit beta n=1 Tax=Lewinella sp. W8 TaxID=2528208 RepID=UPI001067BA8F|nr:NAD(P)(+) transhydrogenase (Re/Si-specific) subunit beta [Lewinella sp. W8]MTB52499.1 NAD(P)(+) transhydrogenase (Re/Si-specific) subunit beta [Lewinella sp. W8]